MSVTVREAGFATLAIRVAKGGELAKIGMLTMTVTRSSLLEWLRPPSPALLTPDDARELGQILGRTDATSDPLDDARHLIRIYRRLSSAGRTEFVKLLAGECARADEEAVAAARQLLATEPVSARAARAVLEPSYLRLLRRFGGVDGGAAIAVQLRSELRALRHSDPAAAALEAELRDVLAAWFEPSSFEVRRVTWDAPASLLEMLASLEAVHAVRGWDDLKNRVDADRRVYALFHPLLEDRPVAFTQIATTRGLAASIDALLDPTAPTTDPAAADTAIFYSISATERGMSGLGVGTTLIERAIAELRGELPRLKTFATLSPLPGFVQWLRQEQPGTEMSDLLGAAARGDDAARMPLLRLAARYLMPAQAGRRARDPVANFHLSNGARIERLNWQADLSEAGRQASAGVMVNYLYPLRERERNRARYLEDGSIPASTAVAKLAASGAGAGA